MDKPKIDSLKSAKPTSKSRPPGKKPSKPKRPNTGASQSGKGKGEEQEVVLTEKVDPEKVKAAIRDFIVSIEDERQRRALQTIFEHFRTTRQEVEQALVRMKDKIEKEIVGSTLKVDTLNREFGVTAEGKFIMKIQSKDGPKSGTWRATPLLEEFIKHYQVYLTDKSRLDAFGHNIDGCLRPVIEKFEYEVRVAKTKRHDAINAHLAAYRTMAETKAAEDEEKLLELVKELGLSEKTVIEGATEAKEGEEKVARKEPNILRAGNNAGLKRKNGEKILKRAVRKRGTV